jgi:Uma2 family endonuclease
MTDTIMNEASKDVAIRDIIQEMEHANPKSRYTLEEYIRLEAESEDKHEFRDGQIIDMSGGSLQHSRISAAVIRQLGNRLEGSPCSVFDSNLRIQIARKKLYSYGDATVICGEPSLSDVDGIGPTYTNPKLVVEVLSPSTRKFDQTTKFDGLRELESFEEYVLIEQDEPRVETRYRHPDGHWGIDFALGLESSILLRSLSISLPLAGIYSGVAFPPEIEQARVP